MDTKDNMNFLEKKWIKTKFRMDSFEYGIYNRKGQPFLFKKGDKIFIYYEKLDNVKSWEIGVLVTDVKSFPNGTWLHFPSILHKTENEESPNQIHIADPTVVYYKNQYHMWVDMYNIDTKWTLGHAISNDGIGWKTLQENGQSKIILNTGEDGKWDGGFVHAPEVFIYKDKFRFIYNAVSTTSNKYLKYSAGVAKLSDDTDLNSKLIRLGRATYPDTLFTKRADRLFSPFWYENKLYAVLSSINKKGQASGFFFVTSIDGGQSWNEISIVPNNLWLHSFLIHNNKLWAINQKDQYLYYLEEDLK